MDGRGSVELDRQAAASVSEGEVAEAVAAEAGVRRRSELQSAAVTGTGVSREEGRGSEAVHAGLRPHAGGRAVVLSGGKAGGRHS